jgi:hypothetical protein
MTAREEVPSVDEWNISDRRVTPNIPSGGIGSFEAGNKSLNNQYQASATNLFTGGGSHEVKYGVLVQGVDYNQLNDRTGPTFITPVGDETATGASIQILSDPTYGSIWRVTRANLNIARETSQLNSSFYVQDTWRVGRVTLNPGVRYDQQHLTGTLDDFTLKNNWSPRIGVTYDPSGTGRTKVYGHYGRYYSQIPNDLAARALSADAGIGADYFDATTQPVPTASALEREAYRSPARFRPHRPERRVGYYNEHSPASVPDAARRWASDMCIEHRPRPEDISRSRSSPDLGIEGADRSTTR